MKNLIKDNKPACTGAEGLLYRPVFTRAAGQSPFVPARDLASCRHNHEKSVQRASYDLYDDGWILFF